MPHEIRTRLSSDPATWQQYRFRERVSAFLDTDISRMIVDLNRAPVPSSPEASRWVIKQKTVFELRYTETDPFLISESSISY